MKNITVHFNNEQKDMKVFTKITEYNITQDNILYMKDNNNYETFCNLQHILYFNIYDTEPIPVVNI